MRRIIVCADDFGIAPAANEAILKLARIGAISAVSVLVDGQFNVAQLASVRQMPPGVAVGLHVNLTSNPVPRASGTLPMWLLRSYLRFGIDRELLQDEIVRQCDQFEGLIGRRPDFIDGHEHVHQLPVIRTAILAVAVQRYGARCLVRTTTGTRGRGLKSAVIAALGGRALRAELQQRGIASNRDFAGVYDFSLRIPYAARMEQWLGDIADGGLIMCHPQRPGLGASDPSREAEFSLLGSARWREMLQQNRIVLQPFRVGAVS